MVDATSLMPDEKAELCEETDSDLECGAETLSLAGVIAGAFWLPTAEDGVVMPEEADRVLSEREGGSGVRKLPESAEDCLVMLVAGAAVSVDIGACPSARSASLLVDRWLSIAFAEEGVEGR